MLRWSSFPRAQNHAAEAIARARDFDAARVEDRQWVSYAREAGRPSDLTTGPVEIKPQTPRITSEDSFTKDDRWDSRAGIPRTPRQ